jgi:peptidoglycan hydrolase-like protein with peptidoglycan-binding domain
MPFPNLTAVNTPRELSGLPGSTLSELQVALARTGYPIKAIDGLYGSNTASCWAAFCTDTVPSNPDLVTPGAVTGLLHKIDVLVAIEGGPQAAQDQVIAAIIAESNALGLTLRSQHAYIAATTYWETAHTFHPVREAFYLPDPDAYLRAKPYYPYYGRGYVQLTWRQNYQQYGQILQRDLANDADLALDPTLALFVLVHGFKLGAFTGHKITDYINQAGTDFMKARLCINGTDRAADIAAIAQSYMTNLPT